MYPSAGMNAAAAAAAVAAAARHPVCMKSSFCLILFLSLYPGGKTRRNAGNLGRFSLPLGIEEPLQSAASIFNLVV